MWLWDWITGGPAAGAAGPLPRASGSTFGLNDAQMREFIRNAGRGDDWLRNSANLRCVLIIANAIGMLPANLNALDRDGNALGKAKDHPVHRLLSRRPNHYQTPLIFKRALTMQALMSGNAYALPIRTGSRVSELIPFPKGSVRTEQQDDLSVVHIATTKAGEKRYRPGEILHLMGPSEDGVSGLSMLDAAKDTLALWRDSTAALRAANQQGANPGGSLEFPEGKMLDEEAHARLKADVNSEYSGPENAGKWMVLEDGLKANLFKHDLKSAQAVESRNQQVEDIARIYGVPRPFLMLDDTSWGTGIEQLAIFFVQYALAPWMVAWEQAIMFTLLPEADFERYQMKFNERALLRGSMKDQAEFLSKLLGGTQAPGVIDQNEARGWLDLSPKAGGDRLSPPPTVTS
jgi:HK97 family phage portal protein